MNRLLIATTNPAKLAEYHLLLRAYPLQLLSLADVGIDDEPAETEATFRANALLKAHFYFARAAIATLADDGGLEVDALDGAPGVASHRWLGAQADDAALARGIIQRMERVSADRRSARLRCALALVYRKDGALVERVTEAAMEGVIGARVHTPIRKGFPYRAVMYIPERGCYVAQLGDEEEAQLSQRRIAVRQADPYLREIGADRGQGG